MVEMASKEETEKMEILNKFNNIDSQIWLVEEIIHGNKNKVNKNL